MTTTQPRQTAGNNAFLARCKVWLNGPIYREASNRLNEGGEEAARAYLSRYFRTLDFLNEVPANVE